MKYRIHKLIVAIILILPFLLIQVPVYGAAEAQHGTITALTDGGGQPIQESYAVQREFLDEIIASGEDHCPCTAACPHHGNCFECVQIHRGHGDHLPHCLHKALNKKIAILSELTEHSIVNEIKQPSYITGEE